MSSRILLFIALLGGGGAVGGGGGAGAGATIARADTVWISSGGGANALQVNGVQITGVEGGKLVFLTNGRETTRELRQVARVRAEDEPALSAAEEAFAAGKFDVATDAYQKALGASAKEWVKTWAAVRLTVAGQRANRFDAAARGYVALLVRDPARAAEFKPAPPNAQSTFIPAAVSEIDAALGTPNLSAASKQALEAFRVELQGARATPAAASPSAAPPPAEQIASAVADATVAAASAQQARQKLDAVGALLDRNDYAAAVTGIRASATLFTQPREQAQALYFLAEAQAGLAAGAAAKNDVPSWQDAAIAYLRVVAHFASAPATKPFAARSLLKAAKIQHEKLADPRAARLLYEQLIKEFPGDPAAAEATAALSRLQG